MATSTSETTANAPDQRSRFDLPGYNLPLNYTPHDKSLFPNALHYQPDYDPGDAVYKISTLRERTMLQIMNELTDKPDWHMKVFDEKIVAKWKKETINVPGRGASEHRYTNTTVNEANIVSPAMMDWIIDELRWRAEDYEKSRMCFVYNGDVIKSDDAVPALLKQGLQQAVLALQDVPESHKDWHPGSDGKVLDLVHPSLFPLVYGRSRVMPDTLVTLDSCKTLAGRGQTLEPRPLSETYETTPECADEGHYSRKYQWLPCDVAFQDCSSSTECEIKITSYINNLDPQKHDNLYNIIERILTKTIPLWERTLSALSDDYSTEPLTRVPYDKVAYRSFDELTDEEKLEKFGEDKRSNEYFRNLTVWEDQQREKHLIYPDAGTFKVKQPLSDRRTFSMQEAFGKTGMQVIVKLANIELTPEDPAYEGGSWHVEGQLNEHICATALYYYDMDNILESDLSFRQIVAVDYENLPSYNQSDHAWLERIFGLRNEYNFTPGDEGDGAVQDVGAVHCKEGRLITFPNVLLHRVEPFKLKDPTKPGHRKILALFLVDPHLRIISTANVPPQQLDWWWSEHILRDARNPITSKLPPELRAEIFHRIDGGTFPMTLEEAKELRLELMSERSKLVDEKSEQLQQRTFNLCEH